MKPRKRAARLADARVLGLEAVDLRGVVIIVIPFGRELTDD
jgi:hypothetical protein